MATSRDKLQQQLAEHLFAGDAQQAWLLFDAMQMDARVGIPDDIPDKDIHVVPLKRDDIPQERYPHLVSIRPHDMERIRTSLDMAMAEQGDSDLEQKAGFATGGWLQSDAPAGKLARHLAACMNQRLPNEGRKYFRWADRRVMEWMWSAQEKSAQAALLGPVTVWWTLDRRNHLVEHRASPAVASEIPWRLTDKAWQHALDCEPVQALLRGWQRFAPDLPSDYLARAAHAVRAARSLGLQNMADIVLVGAYVLQIHPDLCMHPRMRALVQQAKTQDQPLADALSEVPDPEGWDCMRAELAHTKVPATQTPRSASHA